MFNKKKRILLILLKDGPIKINWIGSIIIKPIWMTSITLINETFAKGLISSIFVLINKKIDKKIKVTNVVRLIESSLVELTCDFTIFCVKNGQL